MKQVELVQQVVDAAVEVREVLGPGLTTATYSTCLCQEMNARKIKFKRDSSYPVVYKNIDTDSKVTVDILVENQIVVQVTKAQHFCAEDTSAIMAQMQHSGKPTGILINFELGGTVNGVRHLVLNI